MTEIILKLIDQLNSSVVILLLVVVLAFYGTVLVTRLVEQFKHHKSKLDRFEGLHDRLVEVKTKVDLIYQNTNPNKLVASQSPISITEAGKAIAAKINANAIFQRHVVKLTNLVEEASPKTAYDVQVKSMAVAREKLMNLLNADDINAIKQEAFNRGLLVEDIMSVFGVLLRDHVLKVKDMPVADVDKTPPGDLPSA